jgi:iron complex outermembrane receptor protein/outer membrane receptor for ferrienterochelin and colicins
MRYSTRGIFLLFLLLCFSSGLLPGSAIGDDGDVNSENVFTLGEVVSTATRSDVNIATTVSEFSADDIIATGSLTVAEALDQIPGVVVQTGGKGQSFVSIRGFDQRDVKILIDGVPAHESYYGTVDLSMLPTEAIAKITVTKGASSVLYGANTMGGIINIITKKGDGTPATDMTTSVGNDGTYSFTANQGGSLGTLDYWLTYGYSASDGFRLSDDFDASDPVVGIGSDYNEDGGLRDLSDYIKRSLNAKIGYSENEASSVYLSFDYHNNERGVPTENSRYWAFTQWDQWQLDLVGRHDLTDSVRIKARAFYVKHDDTLTDVSWDEDHTTGRKFFETSSYDDNSRGAELHGFLDFGKLADLKVGFNYLRDIHKQQDYLDDESMGTPGYSDVEEYSADTYTFALEDEMKPTDHLSVIVGASYDFFKPIKAYDQPAPGKVSTLNPQAGIVYTVNDATDLHASVGKKTRFPKLLELYSEHAGGNPDLDPQKTISWEVSASHRFFETFSGAVSYFYNDISDLIDRERDDEGEWVYYNLYEAVIQGVELNMDYQPTDNFLASLNYTYMDTEDKANEGRELEGRPEHRVNLDLRHRFRSKFSASVQASYTKGSYWEDPDDNWIELSDYFLVNLRVTQPLTGFSGVNAEIFLQVSNLFDVDYYETNGPEPGQNFLGGISMRF